MTPRRRSAALAVLAVCLVALSLPVLVAAWRQSALRTDASPLLYHAGTLAFNYVDFGFVRRGLAGTVVLFLEPNLLRATAIFHVLSVLALVAVACRLLHGLRRPPWTLAAFAGVLLALMTRWGEDPGRTDLLVATTVALAAMALARGRPVLAAIALAFGLAVHESGYVFGVPLALAWLMDDGRWERVPPAARWGAASVVVATLAVYAALPSLPHADTATMVEGVRARLPRSDTVDWSIYYAVGGGRGVATALCQNRIDPTYLRHVLSGALVIALVAAALRGAGRASWGALALAGWAPYAFLCIVANDTSRWTVLGAFNVWVLCALAPSAHRADAAPAIRRYGPVATAALVALLVHPAFFRGDTSIYTPSPLVDRVAQRLGAAATPRFPLVLATCDPTWRSVLDPEPSAPAAGTP